MSPLGSNSGPLTEHDYCQQQVHSNPPIAPQPHQPSVIYYHHPPPSSLSTGAVYALWLPPLGLLGIHRAALGHTGWCVIYFFTGGFLLLGWLLDAFRIPTMIERQKKDPQRLKYYKDDVYLVWFIFGLIGGHHLYMRRYPWFFAYFFTLGLFGLGWLVDLILIPIYVRNKNKDVEPTALPGYDDSQPQYPSHSATGPSLVHVHIHGQNAGIPNYGSYGPFQAPQTQYQAPPTQTQYQAPATTSQGPPNEQPPAYGEVFHKN